MNVKMNEKIITKTYAADHADSVGVNFKNSGL